MTLTWPRAKRQRISSRCMYTMKGFTASAAPKLQQQRFGPQRIKEEGANRNVILDQDRGTGAKFFGELQEKPAARQQPSTSQQANTSSTTLQSTAACNCHQVISSGLRLCTPPLKGPSTSTPSQALTACNLSAKITPLFLFSQHKHHESQLKRPSCLGAGYDRQ